MSDFSVDSHISSVTVVPMQIDTDIPLPKERARPGSLKGAILKMEVGHSIHVPNLGSLRSELKFHRDRQFTVRKFRGGHRCWRVA